MFESKNVRIWDRIRLLWFHLVPIKGPDSQYFIIFVTYEWVQ
jgi:hypothetical protein